MPNPREALIELETKFWQSMIDQDTDAALELLAEPALMVSSHGAMKFDHAGYRKMADQGSMVVTGFEFSGVEVVFPNETTAIVTYGVKQAVANRDKSGSMSQEMVDSSTWIRANGGWRCVMHTESPVESKQAEKH